MRNAVSILVHPARHAQLAALAAAQGIPAATLLERLISDEMAKGIVADRIPSMPLYSGDGFIHVEIGHLAGPRLSPAVARQIADAFEALIDGTDTAGKTFVFDGPIEWLFARKGRGLVTSLSQGGQKAIESFTPALAKDYVRQLRAAADKAEKQQA